MNEFWFYAELGFYHVMNIKAYDHILFFAVLVVPYLFKDWKRVLWLVTIFTLGHTISLLLSVYNILSIKVAYVEFLIPLTIFITGLYNVFTAGKSVSSDKINLFFFSSLFFGLIHGLGFAGYFKQMVAEQDAKFLKTLVFALGVEGAQLLVAFIILLIGVIVQSVFRFNRRDWIMILSAIIIGITIPMLIERYPF